MLGLHQCIASPLLPHTTLTSHSSSQVKYSFPFGTVTLPKRNYCRAKRDFGTPAAKKSAENAQLENEEVEVHDSDFNEDFEVEVHDSDFNEDFDGFRSDFSSSSGFKGTEEQKDYDKDPEFAEIIGSSLIDPQNAKSKVEERVRRKRNKILQTKTGSAKPMKVTFNKFDFSNSYIWFEFYNTPLDKDVSLICDTIRAWHIIGRLGGCNSMNMQLSQSNFDKRPQYDDIQGANVTPSTFYNIGDLEIQENLARIWVDIGTSEPLLLDVLINALTQISSDFVGIKQLVFGGSEFENWKENLTSEDAGSSVHKI